MKSTAAKPRARKPAGAGTLKKEAEVEVVAVAEEKTDAVATEPAPEEKKQKFDESKLNQILVFFDALVEDSSVPRNVRATISEAKQRLVGATDLPTGVSATVYLLDEVSNDINLPGHARTIIWNILSELEAMKDQLRK